METDQAKNAVIWAENILMSNGPKLTVEQRSLWLKFAMEYTREEWKEGIENYYVNRLKDFPPPLGELRTYFKFRHSHQTQTNM